MNDIEIRALYRELMEPATDPETTNRQRKLAAVAFAHEPYHLDRSAWEPCMLCAVGYWKQIEYSFCPCCGRPLTDAAWEMLERRIARHEQQ